MHVAILHLIVITRRRKGNPAPLTGNAVVRLPVKHIIHTTAAKQYERIALTTGHKRTFNKHSRLWSKQHPHTRRYGKSRAFCHPERVFNKIRASRRQACILVQQHMLHNIYILGYSLQNNLLHYPALECKH